MIEGLPPHGDRWADDANSANGAQRQKCAICLEDDAVGWDGIISGNRRMSAVQSGGN